MHEELLKQPLAARQLMSPLLESPLKLLSCSFWGRTRPKSLEREQEGLKKQKRKEGRGEES